MIDKQKTYSINAFFLKAAMLILMLFVSNQLFAESVSDIPVRYFSQHGDMCDSCSKNSTSVRYLQIVLNNDSQLNLSPKLVEDGIWGKKTKAAVVTFQFKYLSSPEANGEVRLKTKEKLDVVLARIKLTPVVKPNSPEQVDASDGTYSDKVEVIWSDTLNTSNYRLYRCTSILTSSCSDIYSDKRAQYFDTRAKLGVKYYYRVKSCNAASCSNYSTPNQGFRKFIDPPDTAFKYISGSDIRSFNSTQNNMWSVYAEYILPEIGLIKNTHISQLDVHTTRIERILKIKDSWEKAGFVYDSKTNDIASLRVTALSKTLEHGEYAKYFAPVVEISYETAACYKGLRNLDWDDCASLAIDTVLNVTGAGIAIWDGNKIDEIFEQLNAITIADAFIHKSILQQQSLLITNETIEELFQELLNKNYFVYEPSYDKELAKTLSNKFLIYLERLLASIPPSFSVSRLSPENVSVKDSPIKLYFYGQGLKANMQVLWKPEGSKEWKAISATPNIENDKLAVEIQLGKNVDKIWEFKILDLTRHEASNIMKLRINKSSEVTNLAPYKPAVSIQSGTDNTSFTPTITTSSFNDPDSGDTHDATWWEISKTGNVFWDTGWNEANLTSIVIPIGVLDPETSYTVNVRHRDNRGAFSDMASETFTTKDAIGADNKPDLAVINVSVSNTSPIVGESIQLEADIKNIGSATATSTHTRYYVSTDSNITTSDTEVDSETTSSLDAGETDFERETFSAPATSGTYWVGMCADVVSNESNTTNNCSVGVRITVTGNTTGNKPDWVLINPSVSKANVQTGERIRFTVMLKNQGTSKADNSQIKFYISHDSVIGSDDELKRSEQSTSLDSGEQDPLENKGMDAPDTKGTYWVGACIDAVSNESNTANNCSSGVRVEVTESTYSDDFSFERVSVDKSIVEAGGSLALYAKEEYSGNRTANRVENTIAYLLKSQNDSSIQEVYLADDIGVPSNGSTSGKRETVTIPINTKSGLYFIVFIADYPNEYAETNENNNTAQVAIEVIENTTISFNLDIDGDGEVKPLTDGLLNLRYQFGFRGDTLINGAVDASATRKTADEIETYLIEGGLSLDIDGDGEIKPLTDGLLSLRYMFGFRGDTLINGAVGDSATRKTSGDIETFIESKLH